jgi:hypothetical protein
VWSGIIAGAVFLVLELVLWPVAGLGRPGEPVRMIAAIVLGPDVLPPPAGLQPGILLAAMLVHLSLSVLYATLYAAFRVWVLSRRMEWLRPYSHGLFGLAIYLVNFYGFTVLFPWFIDARHSTSIVVHIAWGMILPAAYDAKADRKTAAHVP